MVEDLRREVGGEEYVGFYGEEKLREVVEDMGKVLEGEEGNYTRRDVAEMFRGVF